MRFPNARPSSYGKKKGKKEEKSGNLYTVKDVRHMRSLKTETISESGEESKTEIKFDILINRLFD